MAENSANLVVDINLQTTAYECTVQRGLTEKFTLL